MGRAVGGGGWEERLKDSTLIRALDECLKALDRGEADIEVLIDRYPQVKRDLRPLLEIASRLRERGAEPKPSPTYLLQLRRQLLEGN